MPTIDVATFEAQVNARKALEQLRSDPDAQIRQRAEEIVRALNPARAKEDLDASRSLALDIRQPVTARLNAMAAIRERLR